MIKAGASCYEHRYILIVEAIGLRDEISSTIQEGFKKLIIEADNQIVM